MSLNGFSDKLNDVDVVIDSGTVDDQYSAEVLEAIANIINTLTEDDISNLDLLGIQFSDAEIGAISSDLNKVLENTDATINGTDTAHIPIPNLLPAPQATLPYNPFYPSSFSSKPPPITINPLSLHLSLTETQNDNSVNATTNYSILSPEPLIFHYENEKKRKRHVELNTDRTAENDMDDSVLLSISMLKKKHSAVNDTVLLGQLGIEQATLDASKVRLKNKGYLPQEGKHWHRMTEKGKEHANHLNEALLAQPKLKRNKIFP